MLMDDFIIYALMAGIGISLITGPLGCFIVWRRMAFFGETLSHSALTGVALGLLFDHAVYMGILGVSILIALLLALFTSQKSLTTDAWLAVISNGTLSMGLIALTFVNSKPIELNGYLFGDILAVSEKDIGIIFASSILILSILFYIWRPLLSLTIHEELAAVEGQSILKIRVLFMLLIAFTVAIALKILGALLLTAMLIIPAAAARQLSKTPEQMAMIAIAISIFSVILGFYGSLVFDVPTSASIVLTSLIAFIGSWIVPRKI
ncbi:MAG: metal ABC transporter permease [Alphaproteobacteria bacterium]|nr:metal ABC transporter permease [Alphaproteobacteria bacterium]